MYDDDGFADPPPGCCSCCNQWIGVAAFWLWQVLLCFGGVAAVMFPSPFKAGEAPSVEACVILGLLGWCYLMVFLNALLAKCTGPGRVPNVWPWNPDAPQNPGFVKRHMTKLNGNPRYCRSSYLYKPDRAHYCRVCKE